MKRPRSGFVALILLAVIAPAGCGSEDARVARVAEAADARQADQNREMARLVQSQQALAQGIDGERRRLDEQRTALDDERRSIARQWVRDPIIANALIGAAVLAACALPLYLALHIWRGAHQSDADEGALAELLVQELVADEPLLLPMPIPPALGAPAASDETAAGASDDV
jgi:hypothetical protein